MSGSADSLVRYSDVVLRADPSRVIARLFVPGHELSMSTESRATGVLSRVLALTEKEVASTLADVLARFGKRHRDFSGILEANYDAIAHRVPHPHSLTLDRKALIGAWFTHEYSIEAAALFNPSIVRHPDQRGLEPGHVRFVMSLRAVGEGHRSSVEFRSGVLGPDQELSLDETVGRVETGRALPPTYERALFGAKLGEAGADEESVRFLLGCLEETFGPIELEAALVLLLGQRVTRQGGVHTIELAHRIADCAYEIEFDADSRLDERVLWPNSWAESHGIEDVRFVHFVDDDGSSTYVATYTAFNGDQIAPQQIATDDFRRFRISQYSGPAATNKGLALFPRKVDGRYLALSRWDRENISIASSIDGETWVDGGVIYRPDLVWELIQTGNCGSPIETEAGWLVLTHGVGPMREYSIAVILLDLDDPTKVIAQMRDPLLRPREVEREGYVPNVAYTCGALLHGDQLVIPYGASDSAVRFAVVDLPRLLARLQSDGPPATMLTNSAT